MGWRDKAVIVQTDVPATVGVGNTVNLKPSWKDRSFSGKPRVNQEMHPDISLSDRAIIKNFSNSPDASVAYLAQKYPSHDVAVNQQGQLIMKRKDEVDFKVIDPDTGIFSTDIINDITDVGYDVPASAIEGGAATLGAIGGAALTAPYGGWGAIPGAMGASAVVGAGDEALRQKLGQVLGIPQDVNYGDVALSGGVSAVSPLLAGAGKAPGILKMTKDFTTQKALPKLGSILSGVSSDSLLNYSDDALRAQLKNLEKDGVEDFSAQAFDKLKNYVETRQLNAGKQMSKAIDETGRLVDVKPAKDSFRIASENLVNDELLTNSDVIKKQKLDDALKQYFGKTDEIINPLNGQRFTNYVEIPDNLPAKKAFQLQQDLKEVAKFNKDMTPEDYLLKSSARDSYFNINKALDEASDGLTSKAKEQYKAALDAEAELLPKFEGSTRADSIQKTYKELSTMGKDSRRILAERLQKLADDGQLDLTNEAKILSTFRELGDPKLMPISSGGTTSTSRSIPLASMGALVGGFSGNQLGITGQPGVDSGLGALGGAAAGTLMGSPAAMKNYIRMHRAMSRGVKTLTPEIENELARRAIRSSWMDLLMDSKNTGN